MQRDYRRAYYAIYIVLASLQIDSLLLFRRRDEASKSAKWKCGAMQRPMFRMENNKNDN